jgi:hypothetical protein
MARQMHTRAGLNMCVIMHILRRVRETQRHKVTSEAGHAKGRARRTRVQADGSGRRSTAFVCGFDQPRSPAFDGGPDGRFGVRGQRRQREGSFFNGRGAACRAAPSAFPVLRIQEPLHATTSGAFCRRRFDNERSIQSGSDPRGSESAIRFIGRVLIAEPERNPASVRLLLPFEVRQRARGAS